MYINYILNHILNFTVGSTAISLGMYVTHGKGNHSEPLGFSPGGGVSLLTLIPKARGRL